MFKDLFDIMFAIIGFIISLYSIYLQKESKGNINYFINSNNLNITQNNIKIDIHHTNSKGRNITLDNSKYLCERIKLLFLVLFVVIFLFCFYRNYNSILSPGINSFNDINHAIYSSIFFSDRIILIILISMSIMFICKGWKKDFSFWENIINLKYFSFKALFDLICLIVVLIFNEKAIVKIYSNSFNHIYSFIPLLMFALPFIEIYWIQLTMEKYFGLIVIRTYKENEKLIIAYLICFLFPLVTAVALFYGIFF